MAGPAIILTRSAILCRGLVRQCTHGKSCPALRRYSPLRPGKWLHFISLAVLLTFSALYEIVEWLASLSNPEDTDSFLGTQGYITDTQTDMFWCLIGSCIAFIALVLLSKIHNKHLTQRGDA